MAVTRATTAQGPWIFADSPEELGRNRAADIEAQRESAPFMPRYVFLGHNGEELFFSLELGKKRKWLRYRFCPPDGVRLPGYHLSGNSYRDSRVTVDPLEAIAWLQEITFPEPEVRSNPRKIGKAKLNPKPAMQADDGFHRAEYHTAWSGWLYQGRLRGTDYAVYLSDREKPICRIIRLEQTRSGLWVKLLPVEDARYVRDPLEIMAIMGEVEPPPRPGR